MNHAKSHGHIVLNVEDVEVMGGVSDGGCGTSPAEPLENLHLSVLPL